VRLDFKLDKQYIRKSFASAALTYDGMAELQRQIGIELLQRYPLRISQGHVLDLGCGTGFITQQLLKSLPIQVKLFALDIALPMCQVTQQKSNAQNSLSIVCADAELLPFSDHSINSIYSNLVLQWCVNLKLLFLDVHRVLEPGGQFIFSTFGPATLQELKSAWKTVDAYTHGNEYYSARQLGAFLEQSGFKQIDLHTQRYVSYYAGVVALMKELKALGAHNASPDRNKQLTGKNRLQAMINSYEQLRVEGMIPATYEVVYLTATRY
jgi:malonyl-CoA O-methyltransferase